MADSTLLTFDADEWETVNYQDFVYKRKKRHTLPTSLARAPPDPQPIDNTLKLKKRRKFLLHVKEKYLAELSLWDQLSNSLKEFEDRVKSKVQLNDSCTVQLHGPCGGEGSPLKDNITGSFVQELLQKVQEQEAMIRNFEKVCDAVDALCDAHEEKAKQGFFDLPIWNSPRKLMASLCDH